MFCGRGYRNWYRMTGLTGWMRTSMGLPAWGRCCCLWHLHRLTSEGEIDILKQQETILKEELETIQKRISEIEKKENII